MTASTALRELLTAHYYNAGWSKKHQGFQCVCGWVGEDHVSHVASVLSTAGFIQVVEETDRKYYYGSADDVLVDRP